MITSNENEETTAAQNNMNELTNIKSRSQIEKNMYLMIAILKSSKSSWPDL